MSVDARLAAPAAAAWLCAGLLIGAPGLAAPVAIAAAILAAGLATAAVVRSSVVVGIAAISCAVAALIATTIGVQGPVRAPEVLVAAAESSRFVTLTIEATESVHPAVERFAATATLVTVSGEATAVSAPVLVFDATPEHAVGLGSTLTVAGTLARTDPADGVAFLVFAVSAAEVAQPPPWYLDWANAVRASFVAAAATLAGDGGILLPGLAIGDDSRVPDSLDSAMKSSSLSHLTAVSGANCAIVIGLIMAVGAAAGVPRSARAGASIVVLLGFVVLVTPEPSVQRAAIMAALVLVSLWGGRPIRGFPLLCVAALGLLAFDPWLSRNYGFALSVLATAGLLVLAGPIARYLARYLPGWVAVVISVPLAAQLACQPVLLLLEPSLSSFGVVANLLAAPAAPVATVLGLLACVALPVLPAIGMLLVHVAWYPSAWIASVARFFDSLPFARLDWPGGAPGLILLAAITVAGLLAVLSRWRKPAALALAAILVLFGAVAGASRLTVTLSRPDWQFAACDVGQGDAMLVRSGGEVALIDTGEEPEPLESCLRDLGIGQIDLLVLTHFDLDHVGGTSAVVGRADRVLVGPTGAQADEELLHELAASGAQVERVHAGARGQLGGLRWEVLWPLERPGGIEPGNDASVAMGFYPLAECENGCLSAVFLGDLGERAQSMLLSRSPLSAVDVVKVSHHGSADQSAALYERLRATVGLIGVGADNDYGHPTDRLLDLLETTGTLAARTDNHGMVLLAPGSEPGSVRFWSQRDGP